MTSFDVKISKQLGRFLDKPPGRTLPSPKKKKITGYFYLQERQFIPLEYKSIL